MKIVEGRAYVVGNPPPHHGGMNWVFVKLTTDQGIHGWGEAYGSEIYFASAAKLIDEMCEHFVVGSDPFQIERLWRTLYASGYNQHPDILKTSAQSAIEIACWDIVGKALGQPIYNLLGGRYHEKIRTYTYLYPAPGDDLPANAAMHYSPERTRLSAEASLELGHTAIKFDPLRTRSTFGPSTLSRDEIDNAEAVVKGVREAVGSRSEILIGTHGQMTAASAIMLAKRLEPLRAVLVGGAGTARERRRDGAGRASTTHSDRDRRAAGHAATNTGCCSRSRRSRPCRWRSVAAAASSRPRRSPRWRKLTTSASRRTCGRARSKRPPASSSTSALRTS